MASDSMFGERELSNERLEEAIFINKQETHGLEEETKPTISYEEAWERELEYQKRINMRLLQPSVGSGSLPVSSQELPPKPKLVQIKREAASPSLPQPALGRCHNHQLPPSQLQVGLAPPQQLQCYQPSPQRLQDRRPLSQQPSFTKPSIPLPKDRLPSPQEFKYRHHLPPQILDRHSQPRQSYDRKPPPQPLNDHLLASSSQLTLLWCNLCEVLCMNALNLEQHCQGKKHKAKRDEVFGSKKGIGLNGDKTVWCHECNVSCPNEMSLAQHRVGKKHALRLRELAVFNVPGGAVVTKESAGPEWAAVFKVSDFHIY